ncbi:hypothetical protein IJG91_02725 [Candidatus Saccharibacteria bacterium]|nr:hypothetical protein [Candidatus Saccharibacteria bacterium]
MKEFLSKNIRPILIIVVITFIGAIAIILTHSLINSSTINVLVAPQSSTIYIDNNLVNNGEVRVTPGRHIVKAEKAGFEAQSMEIDAKSGETSNAFIILNSNSDSTANWYNENPKDALLREKIAGREYNITSQEYEKDFPIITQLPYETMNYTINYGECEYSKFCIYIDAPAGARDVALKVISQFDSNLGRYYYIFNDYINPFSEYIKPNNIVEESIASKDIDRVTEVISDIFKNRKYKVQNAQILDNYIIATVSHIVDDYGDIDTYRLVFQKSNDSFVLLNTPELVLTYAKYPNLPQKIIDAINNL